MASRGGASRSRVRLGPSILLTAAIVLIPVALYAYGRQADAFAVDTVKVSGARHVPRKDALRVLRREFEGRNLFTVTSADVQATLDRFSYLAGVDIDRDFPTTLRVRVIEHRPFAYVLARGRWSLVADTGHVIRQVGSGENAAGQAEGSRSAGGAEPAGGAGQAPGAEPAATAEALVRGPAQMDERLPRMAAVTPLEPHTTVKDTDVLLGLRVLVALPPSLRRRVAVLRVDNERQVTVDLADGPVVVLGAEGSMRAKVLSLRAVLDAYRRAGVEPTMVDVSAPDRPLARPRLSS